MFNTVTIYYIIKKRRVVERETAGARWWAVRFVTDREGRLEVGQPLKVCGPGVSGSTMLCMYSCASTKYDTCTTVHVLHVDDHAHNAML